MKFIPGQGKVREICGWPGKFRKDLESQGKSGNLKISLWQSSKEFIYMYSVHWEKDVLSHDIV